MVAYIRNPGITTPMPAITYINATGGQQLVGVTKPLPTTSMSGGAEASVTNPAAVGPASDAAIVHAGGNTHATINTWTELFAASATRNGAIVQNKGAAVINIVQADATPAVGAVVGMIEIAATAPNNTFNFPFRPRKRYFIMSGTTNIAYGITTW